MIGFKEYLNEISSELAGRYMKKAGEDVDKKHKDTSKGNAEKLTKRVIGMARALKRVAK